MMSRATARTRFRQLLKRALFELRLAAELARSEEFEPRAVALVEGAKRNLRACLDSEPSRIEGQKATNKTEDAA